MIICGGVGHAAQVRGNVHDVGDDQERACRPEDPFRIAPPDHAREAAPGDHAQASAHHLDRRHQGERNERGPEQAITEQGAGHGIGGNAGGIVVGAAGDQAGSEIGKKQFHAILFLAAGRINRAGSRHAK